MFVGVGATPKRRKHRWVDSNSLSVIRNGLVHVALLFVCIASAAVSIGIFRLYPYGLGVVRNRLAFDRAFFS